MACFDAEKSHRREEASAPEATRGGTSQIKKINKIALLPGSGTDFIDEVLNQVDAYITGDISHHHFLLADIAKIGLVQISHIASEIPGIDKFCRDLAKLIKINLTYHKPIFYG